MKIDTLILCGCSTKVSAYVGIFKALLDQNVIQIDNINTIISTSSGSIISVLLTLGYSMAMIEKLIFNISYKKLFNMDELNNFLNLNGLFTNNKIDILIYKLKYHKYKKNSITLKELYDKTKKTLIFKVFNITKEVNEYISYKTHPNIKLNIAIKMTTCLPFLFKPILYDENYYIDGGISGSLPYLSEYKNYLAIYITSITKDDIINNHIQNMNIFKYTQVIIKVLSSLVECSNINKTIFNNNSRLIKVYIQDISTFNFDISLDIKKKLSNQGKQSTIDHLKKHNIITQE